MMNEEKIHALIFSVADDDTYFNFTNIGQFLAREKVEEFLTKIESEIGIPFDDKITDEVLTMTADKASKYLVNLIKKSQEEQQRLKSIGVDRMPRVGDYCKRKCVIIQRKEQNKKITPCHTVCEELCVHNINSPKDVKKQDYLLVRNVEKLCEGYDRVYSEI